jgi:hypothetical protein
MTQQQWLTDNRWEETCLVSFGDYPLVAYRKKFTIFELELWLTGIEWHLSINDNEDEILLAILPLDYDFNKLTPLIKCYDDLNSI